MLFKKMSKRSVLAVVIGNALEWYDFTIYSMLTVFIAKQFFPRTDEAASLLLATATFGIAFCVRPFGGILLGIYADWYGRKAAMTAIIMLMTIATLMFVIVPTYEQIGVLAPLVVVLARILQGFSAGGEFGTSTALLTELAPRAQRGFYCAWQMVGQTLAIVLGALISWLLLDYLDSAIMMSWGWRVPFMFGLCIAPVGYYIRKHLDATHVDDVLQKKKPKSVVKFGTEMLQHTKQFLLASGFVAGGTAATYLNLTHMPTYMHEYLHYPLQISYEILFVCTLVLMLFILISGYLSDLIGRKPILLFSTVSYLLLIYPLYAWLHQVHSIYLLFVVQLLTSILLGLYFGVFAVVIAELFPREIRSTGLSISYNLTVMLCGGFAQFFVTLLIAKLGTSMVMIYYLIAAMGLSVIAALFYREGITKHE